MISADGYFKGENEDISWHSVDDEFNKWAIEHTASFGGLIFGAKTYKLFEEFWPQALKGPQTSPDDRKIAQIIDDIWKMVFSKSIQQVSWKNSKLYHDIDPQEIESWKQYDGKDIAIFGSGEIVKQFTEMGLIDEFRFLVSPIILGKGKALFEGMEKPVKLKLISKREFKNGNILLTYQPA